ncbi:MAG TPA: 50S ribosomal protein L25 [bacterium]|nr:50S ribosomal protein L25 [bacterium]
MAEVTLHVELRSEKGHQSAKALRKQGRLPAVFYAHGEEPVLLSVNHKELQKMLQQENNILDAVFPDGKSRKCILKEIQKNPVTDAPVHVDIMGIKMSEKIKITIPIAFRGTPIGVREGGILEHALREVEVEGLPLDIPEHLEVDISDLKIGDGITLGDLSVDQFKFVTDVHHPVAQVTLPKAARSAAVSGEEEEAEAETQDQEA